MLESRKPDRRTFLASAAATASLGLAGCAGEEEEIDELVIGGAFAVDDPEQVHGTNYFAERIEELTDNRVSVETTIAGDRGPVNERPSLVEDGVLDIGYAVNFYHPDELPLTQVLSAPTPPLSSQEKSEAIWELFDPDQDGIFYREEFSPRGLMPVGNHCSGPYQLWTIPKVETVDDWQGMSVRSAGDVIAEGLNNLGASPEDLTGPDIAQAFERGTVDAVPMGPMYAETYEVHVHGNWVTSNINLGTADSFWLVNEERFESWPEYLRDAVLQAADETRDNLTPELDRVDQEFMDRVADDEDLAEPYEVEDWDAMLDQMGDLFEFWVGRQEDEDIARQVIEDYESALPVDLN